MFFKTYVHYVFTSNNLNTIFQNYALRKLHLTGRTFVPTTISPGKEKQLKRLGTEVIRHGVDCMEGELEARRCSEVNLILSCTNLCNFFFFFVTR